MFSSAFKAFTSNITSNYEISKQPTTSAGVWQVFDARKRSTGIQASVFVFDRKSLEVQGSNFGARISATSIRKAQDHVLERLKKEGSSLAKLRHPSILQLVEPVEETRNGGLMFATELIVASLSAALAQRDEQERSSGRADKPGRPYVEAADGGPQRGELELNELDNQKGLLQVAKGLDFLHDSAKLVHGNLTPEAIFINAKSDWKISGLAFAGPPQGVESSQASPQIALSEVLHDDPRLPRSVQLNLDYTSPDFVMDSNVNVSSDIFSLGLLILALYNSPHRSPIETHGNPSIYKKIFSSNSTVPTASNDFLCSSPLPRELTATLPKILARRPAQRLTAVEFQQSEYFDNILVNTLRFLDALPAKSQNEKAQFMRGLGRVMPQFPASVLGRTVLIALLDEMKDKELLALVLQNVFQIIKTIPLGRVAFSEKVLPMLREVFLGKSKSEEKDSGRDAGLLIILENISLIADNCSAKEFKDDVLPIVYQAMESPVHSLVDTALQSIPSILPLLDFSTVKHDLFPVVAGVFSKTSSLGIKVQGLEALGTLCGASKNATKGVVDDDDFTGFVEKEKPSKTVSSLDKFTMQEKVMPLLKGIKTKEPAVMMAALNVFQIIGKEADTEFVATEIMPILWSFSLGPLLNLPQFKQFMDLIKSLSSRIEREQLRKLQSLSSASKSADRSVISIPALANAHRLSPETTKEVDFERLVLGDRSDGKADVFAGALSGGEKLSPNAPSFSWSSTNQLSNTQRSLSAMTSSQPRPASRSVTPDVSMSSFPSLRPSATTSSPVWTTSLISPSPLQSQPLQPSNPSIPIPAINSNNWQTPKSPPLISSPWQPSSGILQPQTSNLSTLSAFTPALAPPPSSRISSQTNTWQQQPPLPTKPLPQRQQQQPQQAVGFGFNAAQPQPESQKTGLDKYQSLL